MPFCGFEDDLHALRCIEFEVFGKVVKFSCRYRDSSVDIHGVSESPNLFADRHREGDRADDLRK